MSDEELNTIESYFQIFDGNKPINLINDGD